MIFTSVCSHLVYRYTMVNGRVMIDQPSPDKGDDGNYQCRATNKFGTIVSLTVPLKFGCKSD